MKLLPLAVLISALGLNPVLVQAADTPNYNPCRKDYISSGENSIFSNGFTRGIPWPAWMDLLGTQWPKADIERGVLFKPEVINQAIDGIATEIAPPETVKRNRMVVRYYTPEEAADPKATAAYQKAADLYYGEEWDASIKLFDAIVADKKSPYRAAAAYSASRAALNSGDYEDAAKRIHRLIQDPSLREFQLAAFHLIGTRAYQSGSPELIAAHYAEIAHLLKAPASFICRDALAQNVYAGSKENRYGGSMGWVGDLSWYVGSSFGAHKTRRSVLDTLAKNDPFFDLLRSVAAPTPFTRGYGWPAAEATPAGTTSKRFLAKRALALADSSAITAHAREQWLKTKNPLWGYALAQRTAKEEDVTLIRDMIALLPTLPNTPAVQYSLNAFRRHFLLHGARILLMHGRMDDALSLLRDNYKSEEGYTGYYRLYDYNILLNGGIRLFLEQYDLPNARRWAKEASRIFPSVDVDKELRPLLAENSTELFTKEVPGDKHADYGSDRPPLYTARVVWDFLPAQEMLSLSSQPGLSVSEKRTLISSGWLRIYLLEGWKNSLKWLPKLREAFPELATDIDNVNDASSGNKPYLLARMILRVPGFSPIPSLSRTSLAKDEYYYKRARPRWLPASVSDIFAIDSQNPSDGNWWCPADIQQMKIDLADEFFTSPLGYLTHDANNLYVPPSLPDIYLSPYGLQEPEKDKYRQSRLAIADKLLAWHPLLKNADLGELEKLSKVDNGPRLLSEQAIAWAGTSNWFTRFFHLESEYAARYIPETLHLAVRSTRYGCRQAVHGSYSKAAYRILHKQYPQSEWTRKTPYWFKYKAWED